MLTPAASAALVPVVDSRKTMSDANLHRHLSPQSRGSTRRLCRGRPQGSRWRRQHRSHTTTSRSWSRSSSAGRSSRRSSTSAAPHRGHAKRAGTSPPASRIKVAPRPLYLRPPDHLVVFASLPPRPANHRAYSASFVRGLTARLVRLTGQVCDNAQLSCNRTCACMAAELLTLNEHWALAIEGLIGYTYCT
jgi:hypothetical protein